MVYYFQIWNKKEHNIIISAGISSHRVPIYWDIFEWFYIYKNVARNIEQVLAATPHKSPTIRPPASRHENYTS